MYKPLQTREKYYANSILIILSHPNQTTHHPITDYIRDKEWPLLCDVVDDEMWSWFIIIMIAIAVRTQPTSVTLNDDGLLMKNESESSSI